MGIELGDLDGASPEVVWSIVSKNSKYVRGRLPCIGADSHHYSSTEPGNLLSVHRPGDTGFRHLVCFDLQLGKEDGTIDVIEIQPHSNTPNASKLTHTISYTSSRTCYEDILKVTHDKRPDLDKPLWIKLKKLLKVQRPMEEES